MQPTYVHGPKSIVYFRPPNYTMEYARISTLGSSEGFGNGGYGAFVPHQLLSAPRQLCPGNLDQPAALQDVLDVGRQRLGLEHLPAREVLHDPGVDVDRKPVAVLERRMDPGAHHDGQRDVDCVSEEDPGEA